MEKLMDLTIGKLAAKFGISRTTLLYYDRIGLLKPSGRSLAGYRLYNKTDVERLEQIRIYRSAGLSLSEIREALATAKSESLNILENRLKQLNRDIQALRRQQQEILRLIKKQDAWREVRHMTKEHWTDILRAAGFSEADMHRWHMEFERLAPESHQDFLESLNIPEDEIRAIREWSCTVSEDQ